MNFDWPAIEADYRTGQWSDKQLATRYGYRGPSDPANTGPSPQGIGKRARTKGWEKDLTDEVRRLTQARLLNDPAQQLTLAQAVKNAVTHRVSILRDHLEQMAGLRVEATRLQKIVREMGEKMETQKWVGASQRKEYAELLMAAERITTRLQEAERIALDLGASEREDNGFDGLEPLTHTERCRSLLEIMQSGATQGD